MQEYAPGHRFAKWTIIRKDERPYYYVCRCDCGTERSVLIFNLVNGKSLECGHGRRGNRKHGQARKGKLHPLFTTWQGMRQRCCDENAIGYENYGGRGIVVCDEWAEFQSFFDWAMAAGYGPGLTLDRKDNNGPYSPENCRFATRNEQARNKRNSIVLTAFGETKSVADWADDPRAKVGRSVMVWRYHQGWAPEEIITAASWGAYHK